MSLAAHSISNIQENQSDLFLRWFADCGAPLSENKFKIRNFSYFQFSSAFEAKSGRACGAFGRSQNRKLAAIKCAAEYVERKTMLDHFSTANSTQVPESLRTSNGWAIQFTKEEAKRKSYLEALERHLLLLSYLKFGWNGFRLVQKIESSEIDLYFLLSGYSTQGLVSGLVVAKSPLYAGVSFGYCIGEEKLHLSANFWESALYEAIDRILVLNGEKIDLSKDPKSWLLQEAQLFLESDFDLSILQNSFSESVSIEAPNCQTQTFEVHKELDIPTPLFAAYTWGGNLIPIFHKASLTPTCEEYLAKIFKRNDLSMDIPERHPVL